MLASFFSRQMGLCPFILFGRKGYYGAYHTLVFFPFFSSSTFQPNTGVSAFLFYFSGLAPKCQRIYIFVYWPTCHLIG
ncbi:Uncharacterized protein APZ42_008991 [Daphnia magna]|uniref:Uncharacterized protein n=1 Tax=Daphnia magna TaxID=35525 RepID=A0A164EA72_9CRUS|nr:Uncharacterized protein APZ42_008991 [Daphnia magna]